MKTVLWTILLSALAVFAPIKAMLVASGALVFFDLVTGIWASVKTGVPISSNRLGRTVTKIFVYQLSIICGFLVEHYMLTDMLPLAKIASGYVGITELKSIYENLSRVSGQDLLKGILGKLNDRVDDKPPPDSSAGGGAEGLGGDGDGGHH